MQIRVLGCSGAISHPGHTTAFLIDEDILIDAGTGVGRLSQAQLKRIDHVFLTHSHMDHIASLPLLVDAVGGLRARPLIVHALEPTIEALQQCIFNGVIWPDFTKLPTQKRPFLQFEPLDVGQHRDMGGRRIQVLPATHTVPAVGYAVSAVREAGGGADETAASPAWVFAGDSQTDARFWTALDALNVAHLVVDIAFCDQQMALACAAGHLSPRLFIDKLDHLSKDCDYPIYVSHTKPTATDAILGQLTSIAADSHVLRADVPPYDIRQLREDMVFTLN